MTIMGYPAEQISGYILRNSKPFLRRFKKMEEGKRTFNFCAFLFSPFWYLYRKMMNTAVKLYIAIVIISLICAFLCRISVTAATVTAVVLTLAVMIYSGLVADKKYWAVIAEDLDDFGMMTEKEAYYAHVGGRSFLHPAVLFFVTGLIYRMMWIPTFMLLAGIKWPYLN